jgi:hypothetical protein
MTSYISNKNDLVQSDVTSLVKTFGKINDPNPDSTAIAKVNVAPMSINGTDLDICYGLFDQEGIIASREVKETLALLVLEAAKALDIQPEQIVNYSIPSRSKLTMTALGVSMINLLRPVTSQLGVRIPIAKSAKTELVNRNIIA